MCFRFSRLGISANTPRITGSIGMPNPVVMLKGVHYIVIPKSTLSLSINRDKLEKCFIYHRFIPFNKLLSLL